MTKPGTLYVVTAINAMGPVTDSRHDNLLSTWDDIDQCFVRACNPLYRCRMPDSLGRGVVLSLFCISWSGFKTNPVRRHFGWHTIFDHYRENFAVELSRWGDDLYWMYNHPPASGVGNEWGLDWLHNTHYFNILNHFVIDRGYFPSVVQVATERNDASHFLEQWFPFDFGNRNSPNLNLDSANADGKLTGEVIDWRQAPHDWSHYHPDVSNYQLSGAMRRTVFRILDIKTVVHVMQEWEIEAGFLRCLEGHDTVICGYEHDFRDRWETILDLYIGPVVRLRRKYPEIEVRFANALEAVQAVLGRAGEGCPELELVWHREGWRVNSSKPLFGVGPYTCLLEPEEKRYFHLPLAKIGEKVWRFPDSRLPEPAIVGIAANDAAGNSRVVRYRVSGPGSAQLLGADFRVDPDIA